MFFPAISVVVVRLATGEGFRRAWIVPRDFRRTWRYYVIGWFAPMVLIAVGAAVFFLFNPGVFDPSMPGFVATATARMQDAGIAPPSASELQAVGYAQLALQLVGPLLNSVACFGEEWGWRGYLLPHALERVSPVKAALGIGVVWGLWHAPITVLGHNFGLGYPGWPVVGILAMCCFCTALSCLFTWLTLRSGSCLPAVFAHGAVNACGAGPALFMATAANPFVGPAPTGVVGGIGFVAAAALCVVSLRRHPGKPVE